ncbi:acyltransferase [Caulobacter sp. FWC2]|uniref:acyltransferase family protein n=1 Tax=Caulobacter sp. FWC2 TaxID=69664 RepID=UPI00117747BD|nr:acyltransferase [Caulobacter sp. FWC2]
MALLGEAEQPQVHSGGARNGRIDALRFIAMTAVIAQHCDLMPFGWMGVWLFFVISGFVVASSVLDRPLAQGAASELRKFYARRAARILPAYALLVLIAVALQAVDFIELSLSHWSAIILFYYNFYSISHEVWTPNFPLSHLWSISSEMQFYAIAGGLLTLLKRRSLVLALGALALVSVFLRLGVSFAAHSGLVAWEPNKVNFYNVLCQMDGFCAGALLAIYRRGSGPMELSQSWRSGSWD